MLSRQGPQKGIQWVAETIHNSAQCQDCEAGHPGRRDGGLRFPREAVRSWAKAHAEATGHHVNLVQTKVVTYGPKADQ